MERVYLLWHTNPTGANENNEKLIGVYLTQDAAMAAQSRLIGLPGFSSYPEGFDVAAYEVGMDHWTEGYFTE
ncbi:MAG: hypothetical protein ABSC48_04065 [Terracidiphilus sp.]|jgi:hypothetical protein